MIFRHPERLPLPAFALLVSLLGWAGCKLEPLERMQATDPTRLHWEAQDFVVPSSRPQTQISRELAQGLAKTYETLGELERHSTMPDSQAPFLEYLTQKFGEAMLAPDGDNRGWTQAVPLRHLQTDSWKLSMNWAPPRRGRRKNKSAALSKEVDNSSKDWVLRQFRHAGEQRESFPLVRLTPDQLKEPQLGRRVRAQGRFVILDATASSPSELADQLLESNSRWLSTLGEIGAVGCAVFTSLDAEHALWPQLRQEFSSPVTELLAPGEAPPQRLEMVAVANAEASRRWQSWHGGKIAPRGPERSGQGPSMALPLRGAIERNGRVAVEVHSTAKWETEYSILGRQPGAVRPEKVILILSRWNHKKDKQGLGERGNDAALAAQLALIHRAFEWREHGRQSDISLLFGALYGGQAENYAGLAQFLRQKTVRPENIRAVIWLESFSIRDDALDVAVHSNQLPEWLLQLLEHYGGRRLRISPQAPLDRANPLKSLESQRTPVLTFTQAPWLDLPNTKGTSRSSFAPMAELVETLVQLSWAASDLPDQPDSRDTRGPVRRRP